MPPVTCPSETERSLELISEKKKRHFSLVTVTAGRQGHLLTVLGWRIASMKMLLRCPSASVSPRPWILVLHGQPGFL